MIKNSGIVALTVALGLCAACGGGNGGNGTGGVNPPSYNMVGEWDIASNLVSDDCGMFANMPFGHVPHMIERVGNDYFFYTRTEAGFCQVRRYFRSGNTLSRDEDVKWPLNENCELINSATTSITFTSDDSFSSTCDHNFTLLTGPCPLPLPCTARVMGNGQRCNGCWPGCVKSAGPDESTISLFGRRMKFE